MKKLFFSAIAASMILAACNQSAKTAKSADSTAAPMTAATASTAPASAASSATVSAPAGAAVSDGPVMKFEYASHDFGKVNQGDKVTYKFNFTNAGKSPLIISDAVASCGCTTPVWPKGPIKPGDSGQIAVTFNTAGKKELQDKMITITANTNPRQNMVHLVGEVIVKK